MSSFGVSHGNAGCAQGACRLASAALSAPHGVAVSHGNAGCTQGAVGQAVS